MFKPSYNYRGVPIVPTAKNVYRPGRSGSGGPRGKKLLALLILILLVFLCFAVWSLFFPENESTPGSPQITSAVQEKISLPTETSPGIYTAPDPAIAQQTTTEEPPPAAANREPPVSISTEMAGESLETREQFTAYRAIDRAVKAARYPEARTLLEAFLKDLPVENRYYKHAQNLLDKVSGELFRNGVFDAKYTEYTVKSGDTLSKIAARHKTRINAIVKANSLENRDRLRAGQKLKIPGNNWSIVLSVGMKKLFLRENGKLVKIYSLNPALIPALKRSGSFSLRVSTPNQEWKIYGLALPDIQDLLKFAPAGTTVQITE